MAIINISTNSKCYRACSVKGTMLQYGKKVNWYSHYGKQYGASSKN